MRVTSTLQMACVRVVSPKEAPLEKSCWEAEEMWAGNGPADPQWTLALTLFLVFGANPPLSPSMSLFMKHADQALCFSFYC